MNDDEILKIKVDGEEFVHVGDLDRQIEKILFIHRKEIRNIALLTGFTLGMASLEVIRILLEWVYG